MQEVGTLQPPVTNCMPTPWNALFLKSAGGNRDFFYHVQPKAGGGALKKKKKNQPGTEGFSTFGIFFNLHTAALLYCFSCSPNPGALRKILPLHPQQSTPLACGH